MRWGRSSSQVSVTGQRECALSPLQLIQRLRDKHGKVPLLCHETTGNCHRFELAALANRGEGHVEDGTTQTVLVYQHMIGGKFPLVHVTGEMYGPFAFVQEGWWWRLYHVATGLGMCHMIGKGLVVECALALRTMPGVDWSFTRQEDFLATVASSLALRIVQAYERKDGWVF